MYLHMAGGVVNSEYALFAIKVIMAGSTDLAYG
jgi:hypothetical protein